MQGYLITVGLRGFLPYFGLVCVPCCSPLSVRECHHIRPQAETLPLDKREDLGEALLDFATFCLLRICQLGCNLIKPLSIA